MPYLFRRPNPRTVEALERIGAAVRHARRAQYLSQRVLGGLAGVDQGSISRIENGLAPGMRLEYLARIVAVLGPLSVGPSLESQRLDVLLGTNRESVDEPGQGDDELEP